LPLSNLERVTVLRSCQMTRIKRLFLSHLLEQDRPDMVCIRRFEEEMRHLLSRAVDETALDEVVGELPVGLSNWLSPAGQAFDNRIPGENCSYPSY